MRSDTVTISPKGLSLDELDEISVTQLELMDELIICKKEMESHLREGYFMLGKARYIMGVNSVSMLQIPSDDCNIETLYHTSVSEEPLPEVSALTSQLYSIHLNQGRNEAAPLEKEATLRKRGTETDDCDSKEEEEEGEKVENRVSTNPLNWFSALPPQSLRNAQKHFKQVILKCAECATIQSKIDALKI